MDYYRRDDDSAGLFKVICVSSLHPKASDDVVRDTLYREYKKYGDVSVRVMKEDDSGKRVAYIYFRSYKDARDAYESNSRIIIFDMSAVIEPMYAHKSKSSKRRSSRSPSDGDNGDISYGDRYRSRSPPLDRYRSESGSGYNDSSSSYNHQSYHRGRGGGYRYNYGGSRNFSRRGYRGNYDRGGMRGRYYDNQYQQPHMHRYPDFLNHVLPEDDPLATRTLFIGNLESGMTEGELKRIFGRYGNLISVDIKQPNTGTSYAFVRYENLDQSYLAKVELSGQFFGSFQCKIGYGKLYPSPRVWVGGLGTWASTSLLEREFDRFGVIEKIDYHKGDTFAYILFESVHAAENAVHEMRGYPLGGQESRLRMDFADINDDARPKRGGGNNSYYNDRHDTDGSAHKSRRRSSSGRNRSYSDEYDDGKKDWSLPPGSESDLESCDSPIPQTKSISELCRKTSNIWEGGFILKNSVFPTKLYLIRGKESCASTLRDEKDCCIVKITQRLRLDQTKLDDVKKRMESSGSYGVFIGTTSDLNIDVSDEGSNGAKPTECRPLKNLVFYLKQKEAAGVTSVTNKTNDMAGVVYCFPPCTFSRGLIERENWSINSDWEHKNNHLVVVVF